MVNAVDIIASVVIGLVILAVSFYLFAMYCHRILSSYIAQQRGFGNALFPKILVIISQALAWGQLLLLPLDLSITQSDPSSNFIVTYQVIYPIIFALVVFFNPLAMNYYQSDESDNMTARIGWSILYAGIVTAIWSAIIFISFVWLGLYTISGNEYRVNAAIYIFEAMGLIGWILLAFNGGIGLVYLPYDLINGFINRPKRLTPEQAFAKKQELQVRSGELITSGEKLQQKQKEVNRKQGGWFARKRAQGKFSSLLQSYKKQVNKLEEDYQLFDNQLKIKQRHPAVYVAYLLGGIFGTIASLFWLIQLFGTMILKNGAPVFYFIDDWLASLSKGNASFLATILYGIFMLYLQVCLVKGNTVFGIRIPFVLKIHPMMINKTYMNSLLFNSNLMLLASVSSALLALWAFPTYLAASSLGKLSVSAFQNEPLYSAIFGKRIPMILMVSVILLTCLVLIGKVAIRRCRGESGEKEQK